MRLDVISSPEGLRAFRPEWRRFQDVVPAANPFQTTEWLFPWWREFGGGQLHVMVFRSQGVPVGVIPTFLHDWKGRRQCTLLGTGLSDYLDPLFHPDYTEWIVDALGRHVEASHDWEICDWQDLSEGTPLSALGQLREGESCARAPLPADFGAYMEARPHGLKRNLRRYREKAEAAGAVTFEVADRAQPALLDSLIALHRRRWEEAGEAGMIASNGAEKFLRGLEVPVRIVTLRFREAMTAILLALPHRGTICSYLSAFDPEYEKFGFGRELLARAFRYASTSGYQCWDFLRGDESYKFDWGAKRVSKVRLVLAQSTNTRPMP